MTLLFLAATSALGAGRNAGHAGTIAHGCGRPDSRNSITENAPFMKNIIVAPGMLRNHAVLVSDDPAGIGLILGCCMLDACRRIDSKNDSLNVARRMRPSRQSCAMYGPSHSLIMFGSFELQLTRYRTRQ